MQKKIIFSFIVGTLLILQFQCTKPLPAPLPITGTVKFTFKNVVNGNPLVLNTTNYTNQLGQPYTVSKLKYYISNITLSKIGTQFSEKESYHLIDQANISSQSFSFEAIANEYTDVILTIGVDAQRNTSGAQTGALDPLNDMFWTWSTGYIMAKLEGNSPSSTLVNNKIEYHIGGFSGVNNVIKQIVLTIPATSPLLKVQENKISEVIIEADIDKWFSSNVSFTTEPIITSPGTLAKKVADNYQAMFTIKQVINN
jgi:hypothetical protein